MKVNMRIAAAFALLLLSAVSAPLVSAGHWLPGCPHFTSHAHTYNVGQPTAKARTMMWSTSLPSVSSVMVWDGNLAGCSVGGSPGEFDGDHDAGTDGGFFGFGPWSHEPICDHGLTVHGSNVVVNDLVHGSNVAFVLGADDTDGPIINVNPITGAVTCETSGSITPGDPATNPIADSDDCITGVFIGTGTACGAGGDGGYWVFLLSMPNAPTTGTITA